uniref:dolichyl-phosphate-mannose--protein mannosyltransferase n=1 Tax=Sinocyclocheilus anshuiensis TaxID=1608454 RepID=A0A671QAS9_9TELE
MIVELVCSAVALLLYMNTLSADFCYDDSRAIKTNQDLLPDTPWTNILYDDFWGTLLTHSGSHKSFRPLCTLSFRLNYALGSLDPWGYHLVNVGLHCCVTALFTAFCHPLLGGGPWTLLAGLLFASHPIHTEAVAGVVGRADVGAAFCFLLSLISYAQYCLLRANAVHSSGVVWRKVLWLSGSLGATAAALLWKEQGVTVLAMSAIYDLCVVHRLRLQQAVMMVLKRKNMSLLVSLAWLVGFGMILLAARFYWMGNKPPNFSNSDNPAADSPHLLTRVLTFLYLPAVNAWLLLCPDKLSFDWSMDAIPLLRSIADWRNLQSVLFYSGFSLLSWFGLRNPSLQSSKISETNGKSHMSNGKPATNGYSHNHDDNHYRDSNSPKRNGYHKPLRAPQKSLPATESVVVLSLGLLVLPFIPATNMFFYVGFVLAERVLYIPSMGFCLLVTIGLRSMFIRCRSRRSRVSDTLISYLQALKNLNVSSHSGTRTNLLLHISLLKFKSNVCFISCSGLLLQERERFSEALHYYKLAIGSRPTLASAYLNVGIILVSQGNVEEAKRTFHTCADIPDENLKDPHAHKSSVTSCLYNLGKLLHEQGQHEEALSMYKESVQKMPRQFAPQSLYNMMGEAYMRLSNLEEAGHWYRESLKAKPDHIPAHLTYGKLLSIIGQKSEAEHYFLKAIELDPARGNCYMHYSQFLLEESRLGEAAVMAQKAAELDSSEFDVVFSAAHMLRQASLNEAAERYYGKAADLRPDHPAALMNLGAILHLNGKLKEAESNYLRALQLKPDDFITQSNLHKLWNVMQKQGLRASGT